MTDLQRSHKLYGGSDLSPIVDYTEEEWTDWAQTELANAADGGDSTTSTWLVRDEAGVIPDRRGGAQLGAHNVVITTVGSNTLFRGRVEYQDRKRGRQFAQTGAGLNKGRAGEWSVNLSDANSHLSGIIVHNWTRAEETDAARVQALVAAYLSGSPRATTNLNGSNLVVTGSNTITVPAKTYTGVTPSEILSEIAELADKELFVTVDNELAYFGHDYAGYLSGLRISDDPADLNSTTCVPIDPSRSENGRDTLTALRTYWGETTQDTQHTFQRVDETRAEINDYWEDVNFDSDSANLTEAQQRANSILALRKLDQTTYTVTIGAPGSATGQPMVGDDIYKVKAGQLIEFKSLGARGGINADGGHIGDFFLTRRIREVRWTFVGVDAYFCTLLLDRPQAAGKGRNGGTPFHPPFPPDTGTPGTPPVGCTEIASYNWTYDTDLISTGSGAYSWGDNWNDGSKVIYGGLFDAGFAWNGLSDDTLFSTSKHAITPGYQVYLQVDANNRGSSDFSTRQYKVNWYDAAGATGALVSIVTILTLSAVDAVGTYSGTVTAPAGALGFSIKMPRQIGQDNVTVSVLDCSAATPGTDPVPSSDGIPGTVGGTDDGAPSDSDKYIPYGSVLEHLYITEGGPYHDADQIAIDDVGGYYTGTEVEAALQEIGADLATGVAGSGSDDRTGLQLPAVPPWVKPTGSGVITADPQGRLNLDTGTGYKAFMGMTFAEGRLFLVYRHGTDHTTTEDGDIKFRQSADLGRTWTSATTIATHAASHDLRDPCIIYTSRGRMIVAFDDDDGAVRIVSVIYSDDFGQSWSSPVTITDHSFTTLPACTSQPIELHDGTILLPLFGKFSGDSEYSCVVVKSTDHGLTFGDPVTIVDGGAASRTYHEPQIRLLSSGEIVCLIRSDATEHTYRSVSTDNGATWSAVSDVLTATGRPDFVEFYPGALLLFCRNTAAGNDGRWTVSWDKGATWTALQEIDSGVTQNEEYAAPVVLAPGYVVVAYGLETSSTDSDLYVRYYYDGYGTDPLGQIRAKWLQVAEQAAPSTPPSGTGIFYAGTDSKPYYLDDSGTSTDLTATAPSGAAGGDLSGTYPNPSVVDDSHSHTSATLPATTTSTEHVHIVDEVFSGDGATLTFILANEAQPETAIAYVAGTRTSVTVGGSMNDQITFAAAPASATDNVSVDYVAVAT